MADILKSILGDSLFLPSKRRGESVGKDDAVLEGEEKDYDVDGILLPSPTELRRKVILKGERVKGTDAVQEEEIAVVEPVIGSTSMGLQAIVAKIGKEKISEEMLKAAKKMKTSTAGLISALQEHKNIDPALSALIFLDKKKISSFKKVPEKFPVTYLSSFGEDFVELNALAKDSCDNWIEHNKTHIRFLLLIYSTTLFLCCIHLSFSRIFPSGLRIDSSNYDPLLAWSTGSQLVALNTQTNDVHQLMNRVMFTQNGRSGYVLKPPGLWLKKNQKMVRPGGKVRAQDGSPITLGCTIISGQHIPNVVNHEKHKTVVVAKLS